MITNLRGKIELAEAGKKPEPGEFTKPFRAGCQVVHRDSNLNQDKIKTIIKNTGYLGLEVRFAEARLNAKEGLDACDRIDRLTAELKTKDEEIKKLKEEAENRGINQWPR